MKPVWLCLAAALTVTPQAVRLKQNPLITQSMSPTLGDDINGPSVIRVPSWISHPLGRYYLYFAHHKGDHVRLAYADSLSGPWKIYEPGVLHVKDTELYRPQPDPAAGDQFYTHVASPEVIVDEAHKRLVMYVHGFWTAGQNWPAGAAAADRFIRDNGYGQYTQTTVSTDGLHFKVQPGISARTSYLRLFQWRGGWYSMSRLGVLGHTDDLLGKFELGPSAFSGGPDVGKVRHVALMTRGDTLYVFFTRIGDSPERVLLSTLPLSGDWKTWRASPPVEVMAPAAAYECTNLPLTQSKPGEIEGPDRSLRDPGLIEDHGKVLMFYSWCGEQGLAAADVTSFLPAAGRRR